MKFRYDIQGLRALAVIFVLIFHIDKSWLPGGFIGVDMFFVISGYLISSIILHKKRQNSFSFKDFYVGRIKRIVPAYYVFLIVTTIFASMIFFSVDVNKYRAALFWSAIFNSNNYFATLDTYFGAASSENPLLHTWTLAIEMQFYFFLPLMIMFLSFRKAKYIFILLSAIFLTYATYNIVSLDNTDAMYFSLLARTPEFFLGVLLNYFNLRFAGTRSISNLLGIIGLTLLAVSLFLLTETSPFPGVSVLLPCLGTCLILIANKGWLNDVLSKKPFVFVGELSYSIYLWHWPILALYRYASGQYEIDNYTHLLLILIAIFVLSWFSYTYIETSFRQRGLNRKFVISFSSIIILLGISAFSIKKINSEMTTIPVEFSSPAAHGLNSHGSTYSVDEVRGDESATDTLLLLGDSHALTMKSYLELLGKDNNFCFRSVTNDRFPPIPGLNLEDLPFQYRSRQTHLTEIAAEKIGNARVIVLVRAWGAEIPSLEDALNNVVSDLDSSQHLIIFYDYPRVNANPIKITRQIKKDPNSDFEWKSSTRNSPQYISDLEDHYSNVHILDFSTNEVFDDAPFYNDTIMYYDAGHLNKFGAQKYALSTEKEFMALLDSLL